MERSYERTKPGAPGELERARSRIGPCTPAPPRRLGTEVEPHFARVGPLALRRQGPGPVPPLPGGPDRGVAGAAVARVRPLPRRLPLQGPRHVLVPTREQAPGTGRQDRRDLSRSVRDRPRV